MGSMNFTEVQHGSDYFRVKYKVFGVRERLFVAVNYPSDLQRKMEA